MGSVYTFTAFEYGAKKCFLICDKNTYQAAGRQVEEVLALSESLEQEFLKKNLNIYFFANVKIFPHLIVGFFLANIKFT